MPQLDFDISAALTTDTQSAFDTAIKALEAPLAEWRKAPLPHFTLPEKTDDLPALREMAADMAAAFARVIVLGTGGSSLGAQVLAQIHGWGTPSGQSGGPRLVFADNLDATSMAQLLAPEELSDTGFLVVSKSGGTAETMMQLCCVCRLWRPRGLTGAPYFRHLRHGRCGFASAGASIWAAAFGSRSRYWRALCGFVECRPIARAFGRMRH